MIVDREKLIADLLSAFPERLVDGRAAPHECPECDELSAGLAGKTWVDIPNDFLTANSDALPLLSTDAYIAYLPAWLRAGLLDPTGEVAGALPTNVISSPPVEAFTATQATAIKAAVLGIISTNSFGEDDPVNVEDAEKIEQLWAARAHLRAT